MAEPNMLDLPIHLSSQTIFFSPSQWIQPSSVLDKIMLDRVSHRRAFSSGSGSLLFLSCIMSLAAHYGE